MSKNKVSAGNFAFREFTIQQDRCAMKVSTDAVLLGAWAPIPANCKRVLDIGAGTGVLALLAAQRAPHAEVIGVEIDTAAAQQAAENAAASPFQERVKILETSIQDYVRAHQDQFDLIISNPPFFSGGVLNEQLNRQAARHTVKLSHADLLRSVQQLLSPQGVFCLILPKIEGLRFQELAASVKLYPQQILRVRPKMGKPVHRLLMAFSHEALAAPLEEEIVQYAAEREWTPAFDQLVGTYHLR